MISLAIVVLLYPFNIGFAQGVSEYKVKAAFILNFAKFTTWPKGAFDNTSEPFELCVLGDKAIESAFQTISGKKIGSRTLNVRFLDKTDSIEPCDIMFIGKSADRSDVVQRLESVQGKPVLTIGESNYFTKAGGVINFFSNEGRLRFEINRNTAAKQNVKLSSRLLGLAIIVGE